MWPEREVGARGSEAPSKLARSLNNGTTCFGEPESLPMFIFCVSRARLRAVPRWAPCDDRCRGRPPRGPCSSLSEEGAEVMPAGKGHPPPRGSSPLTGWMTPGQPPRRTGAGAQDGSPSECVKLSSLANDKSEKRPLSR